ncbi:thiamine-phosphate kinase [Marinobacter sp.]|uniref:thiamine-phosphate kinase n=1 Tax=Marinobacter sp. TaxID=50741 RepID=UPI0038509385
MGEFELIRQIFMPIARATASAGVLLGPGDDCAIQSLPPDTELAFSVDTLVEGVHFPRHYPPEYLGWRCLAVAASDLAAVGADPACFTLALTLPDSSEPWLSAMGMGLQEAADAFGLTLAGGDVTRGPLTITVQVHGTVPAGQAILRCGAQVGDVVCVSGTLGDASAALQWLDDPAPPAAARELLERYHHPKPRLLLGTMLRNRATAAIDISDGLLSDLSHILDASGVGAIIEEDSLPLSPALQALDPDKAKAHALDGGDDYELCFTLPPAQWDALKALAPDLTVIGRVIKEQGLWLAGQEGKRKVEAAGYDHFGTRE